MSCSSGAGGVTSGLVLDFDMYNQKSFKGAPTTNLLTYSQLFNNWSVGGSVTLEYGFVSPDYTATATRITNLATANIYKSYAATISTVYCVSVYVKKFSSPTITVESNTAASGTMTFNFDTLAIGTSGAYTSPVVSSAGNGWYRISANITTTSTANLNIYLYGNSYGTGGTSYIWGAQLELGSFATPYLPTGASIASRSNAQTLLDLTKNNTLTVSGLTYTSGNVFSFSGTGNIINSPILASSYSSSPFTIEAIFKFTSAGYNQVGILGFNNVFSMKINATAMLTDTYSATSVRNVVSLSPTFVADTWYHICSTFSNGTVSTYCNGVLIGSVNTGENLKSTSDVLTFGSNYGYYTYAGLLPVGRFYNRALSAAEVSQNFNAVRGRYGI